VRGGDGDVLVLFADEGSHLDILWGLLILLSVPALVVLNGFFVAAEFSLVAVRRTRLEELIARGITRARSVLPAVDNLTRTIAATQLGITLSSIALGWASETVLANALEGLIGGLPPPWNAVAGHSIAAALALGVVSFLLVVFGELIPKSMALQSPERVALWVAVPLNVFAIVTRPVNAVINATGRSILHAMGFRSEAETHLHSVEELALLIEDTEEAGLIDPEQADIVQNVFELRNKQVRDCMVPLEKVAALELTMTPEQVLEAVRQGAHTRMPVYAGGPDNVVGIVNTKDLFYLFSLRGVVVLADAMYEPIFLKPDEELGTALLLFRKAKKPMALVRDDDGKIIGMITLEDVLEEIVGDIEDEHDQPRRRPRRPRRLRKVAVTAPAGETRNPKPEVRNKSEAPNPKPEAKAK
jgi:CBS domain containing-hemolysin-like protein